MSSRPLRAAAVLGLVVVLGSLPACSWTYNDTKVATAGLPDVQESLEAQRWVLDPEHSSLEPAPTTEVTLEFDDGTLSGAAPCNQYFGSWTLDDHTLTIEPIGGTLRACVEDDADAAEAAYFAALEGDHEVDVTDRDRLVLTRDGFRLAYVAADD
jgi:heat shock protein HslJ